MTVIVSKPAVNLREELASLRNQGGYQEQQFYFDGLVTNGTFDADTNWTKGTGWTIAAGVATQSGGSSTLTASPTFLKANTTYVVAFEVTSYSAGQVRVYLGGNYGTYRSATGSFTETITCGSTATFFVQGDATFAGSVDNVSVYNTDGTDVIHTMPKGWKPKDVFEDGLLQREGAAHDYEVVYDGFDYVIKPTVAPSATTQTCVIGVKA